MLEFGEVYWLKKFRQKSFENHYAVILGLDTANKAVLFQTFSSRIEHILQFPGMPTPYIDVDAISLLNYRKYDSSILKSPLTKDTGILLWHGVEKESIGVFEDCVKKGRYLLMGKLLKHNAQYLLITMKCATAYKLSEGERALMMSHFKASGYANP